LRVLGQGGFVKERHGSKTGTHGSGDTAKVSARVTAFQQVVGNLFGELQVSAPNFDMGITSGGARVSQSSQAG
jgi:hypothetical protein